MTNLRVESKCICVTGGAGFIGTNLSLMLHQEGHKVVVIDKPTANRDNVKLLENFGVPIRYADLRIPTSIPEVIDSAECIIHLAANGNVVESVQDPFSNFKDNAEATLNLLGAIKNSECQKIIFSSTGGALMGNTPPPVNEQSLPSPISPYGASKLCCEGYINAFAECFGIKALIFRFGNVYGRYSLHKKGVINKFIKSALKSESLTIFGDGNSSRDYIHVNDICQGIGLGLEYRNDKSNVKTFHLANGEEVTLRDLASKIAYIHGKELHLDFKDARQGEVVRNFASYDLAKKELGFEPSVKLEDGLFDTYQWLDEVMQ